MTRSKHTMTRQKKLHKEISLSGESTDNAPDKGPTAYLSFGDFCFVLLCFAIYFFFISTPQQPTN